jgi:hypothetical protein
MLGLGYVLGAKAGRRRYEQIAGTYRALTSSPAAKSMIEAGRRKVADRVSPDARMVTLTEIDDGTSVVEPQRPSVDDRKHGEAGRSGSSRRSSTP